MRRQFGKTIVKLAEKDERIVFVEQSECNIHVLGNSVILNKDSSNEHFGFKK